MRECLFTWCVVLPHSCALAHTARTPYTVRVIRVWSFECQSQFRVLIQYTLFSRQVGNFYFLFRGIKVAALHTVNIIIIQIRCNFGNTLFIVYVVYHFCWKKETYLRSALATEIRRISFLPIHFHSASMRSEREEDEETKENIRTGTRETRGKNMISGQVGRRLAPYACYYCAVRAAICCPLSVLGAQTAIGK